MNKDEIDISNSIRGESCDAGSCPAVEAERELAVESLKAHLSEQRHDFFNLLQVLYGYTQLKKPEKVLEHIKDYCRQMENIGRIYNSKCIKLADLLYTKGKEAESIDIKLEVSAEVSFEPVVRILEEAAVLKAVDYMISGFLYVLDREGCKNVRLAYNLTEYDECFRMELFCRELKEDGLLPVSYEIPGGELYWKKIERNVISFERLEGYCSDNGFDGRMLGNNQGFILSIQKK